MPTQASFWETIYYALICPIAQDQNPVLKSTVRYLLKWAAAVAVAFFLPFSIPLKLVVILTLFIIIAAWNRHKLFQEFKHVPGPTPSFLWGNYHVMISQGFYKKRFVLLEYQKKYGDVFCVHMPLGMQPFVFTRAVTDVSRDHRFDAWRPSGTIWPGSLLGLPDNVLHSIRRKKLLTFSSKRLLAEYLPDMQAITESLLDKWALKSPDTSPSDKTNPKAELAQWSIGMSTKCLFGLDLSDDDKTKANIVMAVEDVVDEVSRRTWEPVYMRVLQWSKMREYATAYLFLRNLAVTLLDRARRDEDLGVPVAPFLQRLVAGLTDGSGTVEHAVLDDILVSCATSVPIGETTGVVLWELSGRPKLQQAVFEDVQRCGEDEVSELTRHVWYEAIRMYPPFPYSAKVVGASEASPVSLGKFELRRSFFLNYFKFGVAVNETLFENAMEFDPFRYDKCSGRDEKLRDFLPFGTGPRACVGQYFAESVSVNFIRQAVKRFEFYRLNDPEKDDNSTMDLGLLGWRLRSD